MAKKMLIDAAHPEQTRVVVVSGNRVEEFDFETAAKKQLKGNIYLAKVTRVEPSLQAAFVEYGGNRHGFLAFSEIHPDYYQIPVEDRLALLEEEAAEAAAEDDELERADEVGGYAAHGGAAPVADDTNGANGDDSTAHETSSADTGEEDVKDDLAGESEAQETAGPASEFAESSEETPVTGGELSPVLEDSGLAPIEIAAPQASEGSALKDSSGENRTADEVGERATAEIIEVAEPREAEAAPESLGAEDALEEVPRRHRRPMRRDKIQEVIKRRQILLVQVVKEERGNKGAALTTYLSLAGRYCVLMPNTDRGGGISRKITNGQDRKRLKDIATELEVPEGMGLIIRTAGANRTRPELKRDFEYLLRLWESVRELTLKSTAPALVYEEGNLVKRSIRDLYGRDIESVLVEGDEAYKEAKAFMKMLTPSHAKNVQQYKDKMPLFQRYQVEQQLDQLYSPRVELRSGGYIIINATEALVAIDVNSGKSTREHSIEETALRTNLEAAEEVARQLRLRDLAGLIVIDFIDMEEHRHNRQVERRLKDCLKTDRARIQVGRISAFGLLEMSRQRLRASVLEGSTLVCSHCSGAGRVPSVETQTLRILRAIEEEGIRGRIQGAHLKAPADVALYLLNYKREMLRQIEERFALPCYIEADAGMRPGQFSLERAESGLIDWTPASAPAISPESGFVETEATAAEDAEIEAEEEPIEAEAALGAVEPVPETNGNRRGRRGRRGGRGRHFREGEQRPSEGTRGEEIPGGGARAESDSTELSRGEEGERRRRRRGRRGGRRNRRDREGFHGQRQQPGAAEGQPLAADSPQPSSEGFQTYVEPLPQSEAERPIGEVPYIREIEIRAPEPEPARTVTPDTANGHSESEAPAPPVEQPMIEQATEQEDPNRPRKKGWWQKRIFG